MGVVGMSGEESGGDRDEGERNCCLRSARSRSLGSPPPISIRADATWVLWVWAEWRRGEGDCQGNCFLRKRAISLTVLFPRRNDAT